MFNSSFGLISVIVKVGDKPVRGMLQTAIAAHHVNLCRANNATHNMSSLARLKSIQEEFMGAK